MNVGKPVLILAALAALVAASAVGWAFSREDRSAADRSSGETTTASLRASPPAVKVVRRQPAPTATPVRPLDAPPTSGSVALTTGTFTDRLAVDDLRLQRGDRPRASGSFLNRTDVSEVLVLVVRADFYDARGRPVGSGEQHFEHAEAFHDEALRFAVRAEAAAPGAVAARVSVPEMVNE